MLCCHLRIHSVLGSVCSFCSTSALQACSVVCLLLLPASVTSSHQATIQNIDSGGPSDPKRGPLELWVADVETGAARPLLSALNTIFDE